jgi:hypothetical protein
VRTFVQLSAAALVEERPFTAPARTDADVAVMRAMLERERAFVCGWRGTPPEGPGALLRERDADGRRHWIRVPDREALPAASELAFVGFFGRARADVDHSVIHKLEEGIVDRLEEIEGVLSYYDLALAEGGYGNLILCSSTGAAANVHQHPLHRRAVELSPRHYHSVRLHDGILPGPLLGDADLVPLRTRYYDYDSRPSWLAVRELPGSMC